MAKLRLVTFLKDVPLSLDATPFLNDDAFLLEAESAVGLATPNPGFREEISYALAWAAEARYRFLDQPPNVLRDILRHLFAAANSLDLAASTMDTMPNKFFELFK